MVLKGIKVVQYILVLFVIGIFFFNDCGNSDTPSDNKRIVENPLPHSMKGYELYSWSVDNLWYFTLITGTNRLKTYEEITTVENTEDNEGWVKITVKNTAALKELLERLLSGENVLWIGDNRVSAAGDNPDFSLPSQSIVQEIETYCMELGVELSVIR